MRRQDPINLLEEILQRTKCCLSLLEEVGVGTGGDEGGEVLAIVDEPDIQSLAMMLPELHRQTRGVVRPDTV
jgi:hypothetical protein